MYMFFLVVDSQKEVFRFLPNEPNWGNFSALARLPLLFPFLVLLTMLSRLENCYNHKITYFLKQEWKISIKHLKNDLIKLFKHFQNQANMCLLRVSRNEDFNSITSSIFNQSKPNLPHFDLLSGDFETGFFGFGHGLSSAVEPWAGHWLSFPQTGIFLGVSAECTRVGVLLAVVSGFGFFLLWVESPLLAFDFEGSWSLFGAGHAFG